MKLLLDQNLSHLLVSRLVDLFPGSDHVRRLNLGQAEDTLIWKYAREHGFILVSQDADFCRAQSFARLAAEADLAPLW